MQQVNLREAQEQLPELVEAALRGEEIVITRDNQPVAKLVQLTENDGDLRLGSAKGLIVIHDDFDEPLEDFQDYM